VFVVMVAAECAPVAQAGGLGDVVFGLSRELELRGNSVEIVLPKYDCLRSVIRRPTEYASANVSGSPAPQRTTQPKATSWTASATAVTPSTAHRLVRRHRIGSVAAAKIGIMTHDVESIRVLASVECMLATIKITPSAVKAAAST